MASSIVISSLDHSWTEGKSPSRTYQPLASPFRSAYPTGTRKCNDIFCLIPFLAVVVITVAFAVNYGNDLIDATRLTELSKSSGVELMLHIIGLSSLAAAGMSIIWIAVMVLLAEVLIWVTFVTIIALNVVATILLMQKALVSNSGWYWLAAMVFGLLALLVMLYTCYIHKRIKFAAAHLKVAGHAVFRLPMTIIVAIVMVGVQISWTIVWVVSSLGVVFHYGFLQLDDLLCTKERCDLEYEPAAIIVVLCLMLLTYFWITFVLRNVIGVTTAGTIAAWKTANNAPCITIEAWVRAMTLNLGSICLGSLIVAILETVVWLLHILTWLAGRSGNCCFVCLFSWLSRLVSSIESWIECFNRFAFSYVGCYNYSFVRASRHVFKLFEAKGWSAIVNDHLIGNLCWLSSIVTGVLTAYVSLQLLVHATDSEEQLAVFLHPQVVSAFFCFVAGYGINTLVMSVITSAVTTIFVLWAEDPTGWHLTRPRQYETLYKTWLEVYPNEFRTGSEVTHCRYHY